MKEYDKNKIIDKLIKDNYVGKSIAYKELQEIHEKYAPFMSEKEFAIEILGISNGNYRKCKINVSKVKILKDMKVSEKTEKKIIKELIEKGYAGKKITCEEIQELHQKYAYWMPQKEFAIKVLGIASYSYDYCKYNDRKATILKDIKISKKADSDNKSTYEKKVSPPKSKFEDEKEMELLKEKIKDNLKTEKRLNKQEVDNFFEYCIKTLGLMKITEEDINMLKTIVLNIPQFATSENINFILAGLTRKNKYQEAIKMLNTCISDELINTNKNRAQSLNQAKIEIQKVMREIQAVELFKYSWYKDDDIARMTGLSTIDVIRLKRKYKEQGKNTSKDNSQKEETR